MILWCARCAKPSGIRLWICPSCGEQADWLEECPTPIFPWRLSLKDWDDLKAWKINPEQPQPVFTKRHTDNTG